MDDLSAAAPAEQAAGAPCAASGGLDADRGTSEDVVEETDVLEHEAGVQTNEQEGLLESTVILGSGPQEVETEWQRRLASRSLVEYPAAGRGIRGVGLYHREYSECNPNSEPRSVTPDGEHEVW